MGSILAINDMRMWTELSVPFFNQILEPKLEHRYALASRNSGTALAPSRVTAVVRRQRLCGAHLRSRLVPVAATRDRIVRDLDRSPVGRLHGRDVSRQPGSLARHLAAPASPENLRGDRAGNRHLRDRGAVRSSAYRSAVCCGGRPGFSRNPVARNRGRRLSIAAHLADGRFCYPRWRAGWKRHRTVFRGSASSTAATSEERYSVACWPDSIC